MKDEQDEDVTPRHVTGIVSKAHGNNYLFLFKSANTLKDIIVVRDFNFLSP